MLPLLIYSIRLMKKILAYIVIAMYGLLTVQTVSAGSSQYGQYGQYGAGSPSYSILVDKMVATGNMTKGGLQTYVDNMSPSDPRFSPGSQVHFQVKVKNTSSVALKNVQVQDVLPEYTDAVEGPGTYDANTRTISWTYSELKSGEERIERIIVQIKPQEQLPADKGLMCLTNKSYVRVENVSDDDTAQFCLEKQVVMTTKGGLPVKTTPEAGAPLLAFAGMNILALAGGIFLKKRA